MASSINCRCRDIKSVYKHGDIHHRHSMFLHFHSLKPLYLLRSPFVCSSLPFTVLGGSAGGVADDVRETRPPDQGGSSGDDEEALQGGGVVGRVAAAAQACFRVVVYDGDAGTGPGVGVGAAPGVMPESQRAAS